MLDTRALATKIVSIHLRSEVLVQNSMMSASKLILEVDRLCCGQDLVVLCRRGKVNERGCLVDEQSTKKRDAPFDVSAELSLSPKSSLMMSE